MISIEHMEKRSVTFEGEEITYFLERKNVKNLNLRIRRDGVVYVSAASFVPVSEIDSFLCKREQFILRAVRKFSKYHERISQPKRYVSGETFYLLGRGLRLKVSVSERDEVFTDGVYIFLETRKMDDIEKKKRLIDRFFKDRCIEVFGEILDELYPKLGKYGVKYPALRIRDMKSRWGTCSYNKNVITINRRLIEMPRNCIEYVVVHELCHFVHPDHSKDFYNFLTMMMPDWREKKFYLENMVYY